MIRVGIIHSGRAIPPISKTTGITRRSGQVINFPDESWVRYFQIRDIIDAHTLAGLEFDLLIYQDFPTKEAQGYLDTLIRRESRDIA